MVESPPPLLAKNEPFSVVGIAALQIANPTNGALFYYQTILDGETCLLQTVIMVGIAVKAGKEIGVAVIPQNAVALPGELFIVNAAITGDGRVRTSGKVILIPDAVRRVG